MKKSEREQKIKYSYELLRVIENKFNNFVERYNRNPEYLVLSYEYMPLLTNEYASYVLGYISNSEKIVRFRGMKVINTFKENTIEVY